MGIITFFTLDITHSLEYISRTQLTGNNLFPSSDVKGVGEYPLERANDEDYLKNAISNVIFV
jgi:hypothetical protein